MKKKMNVVNKFMIDLKYLEEKFAVYYNPIEGYKNLYLGKNDDSEPLAIFSRLSISDALQKAEEKKSRIRYSEGNDEKENCEMKTAVDFLNSLLHLSNENFSFLFENEQWQFIHVKTYDAAIFCNKKECGGVESEWCIGNPDYKNDWIYHSNNRKENFVLALSKNISEIKNRKWVLVLGETDYCCNQENEGFNGLYHLQQFHIDLNFLKEIIETNKIDESFEKIMKFPLEDGKQNSELTKSDELERKFNKVLNLQFRMFSQFLLLPVEEFSPWEVDAITKAYDDFCKALNDCKDFIQALISNNEIENVLADGTLLKKLEYGFIENQKMYENISSGIKKSNLNNGDDCFTKFHQTYSAFLEFWKTLQLLD